MSISASRERWRQVQRLFAEVVGLDPERREARLDRACREDPRLREEVQTLLDRHARGEAVSPGHEQARPPQPSSHVQPPSPFPTSEGKVPREGPSGEVIAGRYRLVAELGRGAMGVVHKALDTRLDRHVALKFLAPHLGADRQARARLTAEAKAVSALDHPHICTLYEIGETDDGRLFLVMAHYEGETLEQIVDRGSLPVADALRIAVQLSRGLGAAHRRGIVHRDVKPSNILVTEEGDAKILDFGIAKVAGSALTRTGDTLGTVEYMSPEQLRGEVDARTDVWALGAVLYEMLSGERPFRGDYEAALLYAILHEEPVPLAERSKDVPEALVEVVQRCLEKDPEARYQSAQEVEEELAELLQAEAPPLPVRTKRRLVRHARWAVPGLGAVALTLALLVPQVRSVLPAWLGGSGAPVIQQLAVVPLSVEGEDTLVGEGLTIALTNFLAQLGSHAEAPFTVVPVSEMWEITTANQARRRLGVEHVLAGKLSFTNDEGRGGDQGRIEVKLAHSYPGGEGHEHLRTTTNMWDMPADGLTMFHVNTLDVWVNQLGVALPVEAYATLYAGGTTSVSAYKNYLRGIAALHHADRPESVDGAIASFQGALQEDSLFALAHAGLGEAYRQKYSATREAEWIGLTERHCARALALAEGLASAHATLGSLYSWAGDRVAALREYERAAALGSTDADVYSNLGLFYTDLGQRDRAEVSFHRAVALQPRTWKHYEGFSRAYAAWGRPDEATELIERFIALVPEDTEDSERLARAYGTLAFHTRDSRQKEAALLRSIALHPTHNAYSNLAYGYSDKGRYAEEAEVLERAVALDSSYHEDWGRLAKAYERIGASRDRIRAAYTQAMETAQPDLAGGQRQADVLLALADYALGLHQLQTAQGFLEQALQVDEYEIVREAVVLYERMGMRAQALELVGRAHANDQLPINFERSDALAELRKDPRYQQIMQSASE